MEIAYTGHYHPAVILEDIPKLGNFEKVRIKHAIETKLLKDPLTFSKPLRRSLHGYRSLRVGDYRVVCKINPGTKQVIIFFIGHRSAVYTSAQQKKRV